MNLNANSLPSNSRINCLIHGCGRTKKNEEDFSVWICQKHWTAVPKKYRKLYAMAKRKHRKGQIGADRVARIWVKCEIKAHENAWAVK